MFSSRKCRLNHRILPAIQKIDSPCCLINQLSLNVYTNNGNVSHRRPTDGLRKQRPEVTEPQGWPTDQFIPDVKNRCVVIYEWDVIYSCVHYGACHEYEKPLG